MSTQSSSSNAKNARMNVLWVFGDQHRAQALSIHGDPNLHTPNLDRFASEGVDVRGAHSGFPLCCPARGTLLTGLLPHRCIPGHEHPMPDGQQTIAHHLEAAGYETAWFGKWHVDGFKEAEGRAAFHTVPRERRGGFRTWIGYENNNSQWDCWVHGHDAKGKEVPHYRLGGFETDVLTDMLIDFLQAHSEGTEDPFFAALSVQPPHDPYTAPETWMQRHSPADIELRPNVPAVPRIEEQARRELSGYCAMIENLDWNFGRIRTALEKTGLAKNTLIVFFSDHGDMHGSHGCFRKLSPWEESIRIPMILGGGTPFYENRQGVAEHLMGLQDLLPTTLGLCGIDTVEGIDGKDFSGLLRKDRPLPEAPESAYLQSVIPTGHENSVCRPWRGILTQDGWKFVCFEDKPWLMFNLHEDPYEQVNLAHESRYEAQRTRLLEALRKWVSDTGDNFSLDTL